MHASAWLCVSFLIHASARRCEEDIEKEACFILGLLAIKAEHQHAIADAGALSGLVRLLKRCARPTAHCTRQLEQQCEHTLTLSAHTGTFRQARCARALQPAWCDERLTQ